jgi:hypothetical protein
MEIAIKMPGRQATDARNTVTLREPGTPWPISFYFLRLIDSETGEHELINVGFEIGEPYEVKAGASAAPIERTPEPVDATTLRRIASNYDAYLQIARNALWVAEPEDLENAIRRLRGPGRKPARLNDDFYRLIAADYDAHLKAGGHPGKELAAKYQTDPSAVSRWIKEARRRGYITSKEGDNG